MENNGSYLRWELLRKLVVLNVRKEISILELSEILNINRSHPYFQEVLKNKNIVKYTKKIGSTQFLLINNKKLMDLVWNSEYVTNGLEVIKIKYPMGFFT